jgi:hypothetical protein
MWDNFGNDNQFKQVVTKINKLIKLTNVTELLFSTQGDIHVYTVHPIWEEIQMHVCVCQNVLLNMQRGW